jgi:hypothetical protein
VNVHGEAVITKHICSVKPLGLCDDNDVDFEYPTRAQLRENLLLSYLSTIKGKTVD